jgi:hypothetical protein
MGLYPASSSIPEPYTSSPPKDLSAGALIPLIVSQRPFKGAANFPIIGDIFKGFRILSFSGVFRTYPDDPTDLLGQTAYARAIFIIIL